jgi:hypothetical protein
MAKKQNKKQNKRRIKKTMARKKPLLAKRVSQKISTLLDHRLLDIATQQYARVLREVKKGKKRLDDEKKLALQLGERIIAKAREVKASLTSK